MAGLACTFHIADEPHNVLIAVNPDFANGQRVAAVFALAPQLVSGPAPEMGLARFDGPPQCLLRHPCKHQYSAAIPVCHNCRDQPVAIKLGLEGETMLNFMSTAAWLELGLGILRHVGFDLVLVAF